MNDALKNMQPFDFENIPTTELRSKWVDYRRNFSYIARTLPKPKRVHLKSVFLARAGRPLQKIVEDLAAQDGLDGELSEDDGPEAYEEMIMQLNDYFAPKQHSTMQRHEFWSMECKEGESLDKFIVRARVAANKCEVGETAREFRDTMVKDKILLVAPTELKNKIFDKGEMTSGRMVSSYLIAKQQTTK